ncbi:MAG: hypothetical protein M3443_14465 [Actinomycetota bacterium]|nr:hypothetical protein [Actinomycetota bacterium]
MKRFIVFAAVMAAGCSAGDSGRRSRVVVDGLTIFTAAITDPDSNRTTPE